MLFSTILLLFGIHVTIVYGVRSIYVSQVRPSCNSNCGGSFLKANENFGSATTFVANTNSRATLFAENGDILYTDGELI
jgi:hypothetical protein